MVERQLRRRGIADERVLEAMGAVPRELFVPEHVRRRAYHDGALPIGGEQTISQPWVVAAICEALELEGSETVLEVGTGSGYSTAVLARLAAMVISIEVLPELAEGARRRIAQLGIEHVEILTGDGTRGAPDRAPFGGIAVHATAPAPPSSLLDQLDVGGILVVPISHRLADDLTAIRRLAAEIDPRSGAGLDRRVIAPCRFVPLIGDEGFRP